MKIMRILLAIIGLIAVTSIGCSNGGGKSPAAPSIEENSPGMSSESRISGNRHFLGIWEIEISEDRSEATVVPLRGAEMHFNMVHILETKCADCLTNNNFVQFFRISKAIRSREQFRTAIDHNPAICYHLPVNQAAQEEMR